MRSTGTQSTTRPSTRRTGRRPSARSCTSGTPDNDQFVGPQDPHVLAEHIQRSEGPSGLNRDYLLELEKALDELSPESGDVHVTDLSDRLREIERRIKTGEEVKTDVNGHPGPVSHEFAKVGSVDEQEETEKV